jgi:hypothetical protein
MHLRSIVVPLLALVILGSVVYARWMRRPAPLVGPPEEAVALPSPSEPAASVAPPASAPTASDVEPLLDHVFDGSLVVDPEIRPRYVTGDFTGDSVADLAAAVRPRDADALTRLNAELSRWRVQDATAPPDRPRGRTDPIVAGERLLAIVHGVAGASWRDAADRPGYLVRNAVGSGMRARPLSGLPPWVRMQVTRSHEGDVILEQRGRSRGLILWTGAAYTWTELPGGD